MSDDTSRILAAEEFVRRFAASIKTVLLYAPDHPIVLRAMDQLADHLDQWLAESAEVVVGLVDREVVVDAIPVPPGAGVSETTDRFRAAGIERIAFARGLAREELTAFVKRLAAVRRRHEDEGGDALQAMASAHISIGRLRVQTRFESSYGDVGTSQESYRDAVAGAEQLWEQARAEDGLDAEMATAVVEGLASAVGQNRRAMMALTALCHYDNYTFTHMVNVSVLTMAQASSLGIGGDHLRQFGMAGLMHDIGKIRTPVEIVTKADKLTDTEFEIIKEHPVDGAELLRRHLELPPLAAVVAFEHHLRIDGTGYPAGVARPSLNLATQLCSVADVYDAMRSKRSYQQAFPTERILAALQQHDGARFDRHLVRRFSQLLGIYPPGNVVRLDTGALAVVLRIHAPDPARPAVRVVVGPDGQRLSDPFDLALWMDDAPSGPPPRIITPVDPKDVGFDPLAFLDGGADA